MYSTNANLVYALKVVNLPGASIAYAAPEVVVRLRKRLICTKELAFAGDIFSCGMITMALLEAGEVWK